MKKTAMHFRIAAWSIKNPKITYTAIAGSLLVVLAVGVSTTWLMGVRNSGASVVAVQGGNGNTGLELDGWSIRKQWANSDLQCVGYIKESNNTRLTSCYKKVGDQWVFVQSY